MSSRAELEAQIAALKAILKEKEIDPEFTPKELVRWDPSLLGTVLHMKHPMSISRSACQTGTFRHDGVYYTYTRKAGHWSNITSELEMEQICPLTRDGLVVNNDVSIDSDSSSTFRLTYTTSNTFQSMTSVALRTSSHGDFMPTQHHNDIKPIACDTLGIIFKRVCSKPDVKYHGMNPCTCLKGTLPLCGPDDNILDHIYIASVVKLPFQDKEVVVDKYPLSVLYEEWKADKAAGRTQRGA